MNYGELRKCGLTDDHSFYLAWCRMKYRCNDTSNEWYGGRGITYDPAWEEFRNFFNDMWSTWVKGLTLDRKDTNGNYYKNNCQWATWREQGQNKRQYKLDVRNTSGRKGVYYSTTRARWLAQVFENGRRRTLYAGTDYETACAVRAEWEVSSGKTLF